jgi:hypothetical protein
MTRIPAFVAIAATALILTACTAAPSTSDSGDSDAPDTSSASGEMFGCTQATLDYIEPLSYANAVPIDPSTLEFPGGITIATVPDCYVIDETDGYQRWGAFFTGDGAQAFAEIDTALTDGGYVQSDDYGPNVWWTADGTDGPTSAEHSVGGGPQVIGGADVFWVTFN